MNKEQMPIAELQAPIVANTLLPAGAVGIRVLSLFDGMSCGQQALERIGVNVLEYYASEIDKHAIAVAMHNYPNTKQLGSVIDVDGYKLPKIDLLIGGSPCQSFSFAGKRKGMSTKCETEILTLEHYLDLKAEGYEFKGQSYLFWEYMRLLNETKPTYFLLENVMMGEKWEKILSKAIGVKPIQINSALVSAQNRNRLYWTNIGMQPMGLFGDLESIIPQPKDKDILLKDILESEVDAKYYLSQQRIETMLKSERSVPYVNEETKKYNCLLAGYNKIPTDGQYLVHNTLPRSSMTVKGKTGLLSRNDGKTYCLDTGSTNAIELFGFIKFGRTDEAKEMRKESMKNGKDYTSFQAKKITGIDYDKMNTLTTAINKDNMVMQLNPSTESNGCQPYQQNRIYDTDGISPALMAQMSCGTHAIKHERKIRRLTPLECERLQTVKDGYTSVASDSQRYRMLGNGWTVDVIAYIFGFMKSELAKSAEW
jgi:DNA (cytosine-5)-methyltransferase 1